MIVCMFVSHSRRGRKRGKSDTVRECVCGCLGFTHRSPSTFHLNTSVVRACVTLSRLTTRRVLYFYTHACVSRAPLLCIYVFLRAGVPTLCVGTCACIYVIFAWQLFSFGRRLSVREASFLVISRRRFSE